MVNHDHYVVIMAGGIGSRFWPYSRYNYPKQFLDVLGTGQSLLQMTYERSLEICPQENIYIVTSERYNHLTLEQLPGLTPEQILLEPNRRNTAPCIAYASYKIAQKNPSAVMAVCPSDHIILKKDVFVDKINIALNEAKASNKLLTLGIKPSRPETGYGYIQFIPDEQEVKKVKTFTEKPELELARTFVESGEFVWNAGIFIWSVNTINNAFDNYMPEMAELFEAGKQHFYTDDEKESIANIYSQCKNVSIDYGVMEKAEDVYVVLGDIGWSDLGSWDSLHEIREKDGNLNVVDARTMIYETRNCYIRAANRDKLVVLQGLEGFLVSDSDDVLLICKKNAEKQFRQFVNDAKNIDEKYV